MKKKILHALLNKEDDYLSGEQLSQMLGVSRTAIWKHMKQLKQEGYEIESVTKRGYKLIKAPTDIDGSALEKALMDDGTMDAFIKQVCYFDTIDSTNTEAKRLGEKGAVVNTLIVANEQTRGKGRLGRNWESPKNQGIFMSLLLKPELAPAFASRFTLVAAAAVAEALKEVTGVQPKIKWPNDLILDNKKVCGILTELSAEMTQIHYIVIGIGINIAQEAFEEALADKAIAIGQVADGKVNRLDIVRAFVSAFRKYYDAFVTEGDVSAAIAYNKAHSATLNREVWLIERTARRRVHAVDIDEAGALIVKTEDGILETVTSGEVSVRGINGYTDDAAAPSNKEV